MFDFGIGTSELLILVMVALIVVGPKELPGLLRTIGRMVGKVKALASEFQGHLDDLAKESGVDDVKKKVQEEFEDLSIEDLDREFTEIEREMREQLAAGAKPLDKAEEADDEDLVDEAERPLPETLDLDEEPEDTGEDGEREAEEESRPAARTPGVEDARDAERTAASGREEPADADAPAEPEEAAAEEPERRPRRATAAAGE